MGVRLKRGYGPSLPALAAARWQRAGWRARAVAAAIVAAALALAAALAVGLRSARYSHGGPVPFAFSYQGLEPVAPEAGGYVRLAERAHGRLAASFAVAPFSLAPYEGSVSGALPLYADAEARALAARFPGFALVGEGPVRTEAFGAWEELPPSTVYYHVPTYTLAFIARVEGEAVAGREIWLLPARPRARSGVAITLLAAVRKRVQAAAKPAGRTTASRTTAGQTSGSEATDSEAAEEAALSLGATGALARPLRTFRLGG